MNPPNAASSSTSSPSRRGLMAGVAAAAAVAGAGLAWWRLQPQEVAPGAEASLWQQQFETPTGAPLDLAALRGKPLLLNFWATWCPPCVEELPMLNAFYQEQRARGWNVLGLAIDQPSAVRKFLERLPLDFPIGLAGLGGTELGRNLGNLNGGLPFTVVFGTEGRILARKMGKVEPADLQRWQSLG